MRKQKYKGNAFFDIDGVLCNFEDGFRDKFGSSNRHLYDFRERYPEHRELIEEFLVDELSYSQADMLFGGVVLLNQSIQKGFYTTLITSRPKKLESTTLGWLDYFNINYDQLVFAEDKFEAIGLTDTSLPTFLVDDCVKHLERLPDGVVGIAWEQPWNVGYYPRALYNPTNMTVFKQLTQNQNYSPFWSQS